MFEIKLKYVIRLLLLLIAISFSSCKKDSNVAVILKEKPKSKTLIERINNYPELKIALQHYSLPKDSLKRKAMFFLINNLENKMGLTKIADKEIVSVYHKTYKSSLSDTFDFRKKYKYPLILNNTNTLDADEIKADELIENVDLAFEAYKFPWAKKVSFNDFCEFVLPHRILDEPMSHWRKFFFHENNKLIKYLLKNKIENPETVCKILNDSMIKRYKFYSKLELPSPNLISLYQNPVGLCMPRYLLYAALARSIGLPIAIDFIPQFGNFAGSHYWVTLIQKKKFSFNAGEKWEPCLFRGIKYFRHVYSNIAKKPDKSPLSNPNVIDVTDQYSDRKIGDLVLELSRTISKDIYLFSFGTSEELVCLQKAKIQNKKIIFKNISYFDDSILFIGYYDKEDIIPLENPFKIHNWTKEISFLFPSKSLVNTIRLFRKFPISFEEGNFFKEVEGAKIQGSDFKDFKIKEDIFTFKTYPENTNEIEVKSQYNFNYYRYLPSESGQINLAELQFVFRRDKEETRKEYYPFDPKYKNIQNLYDNNSRTYYFSSSKFNWIGIDRSKSKYKNLIAVKIAARNTYNLIERGQKYELFYFDFGWKSLGKKTAEDSFVDFTNVPSNCVLLLKNLSEGYQERIFTYDIYNTDTSRQVFW